MKNILFVSLLALIGLSACETYPKYSKPKAIIVENTQTFDKTYDKVWSAVVDFFVEENYAVDKIDKTSGLIISYKMELGEFRAQQMMDNFYCDCGQNEQMAFISNSHEKDGVSVLPNHIQIFINVQDTGNGIKVKINPQYESFYYEYKDREYRINYPCISIGGLEKKIFKYIELYK